MLIRCPWCGERDVSEFSYLGDAGKVRPRNPERATREDWLDYVYTRPNPRGPHLEYWHHAAGCRQWIRVRRDTLTHEVLAAAPANQALEEGAAE